MSRWGQIDIGRLRDGYRMLEEQSTLSDSSDDESIVSHVYDDLCCDEGSSYFDSESESLLKLVNAEKPSIDEAKHFLSDLTAAAADIGEAIEQKDRKGNRVIHYACAKALVPWVELLIDNKADLNVKGKDGQRPLHFAVKGEGTNVSRFENAMLLLKNGADPLAKDEAREDTALHIILRKGQVKYALRFLETCDQKGYDMQEILLARNANQQCVIDKVVKCGCKELVTYCLEHVHQSDDRDILSEITPKDGLTLMHTVCRYGHRDIVKMLDDKWPKLLACPNKRGLMPLHVACSRNHAEVATIICNLLKESKRGDEYIHIGMKESDSVLKYAAKKGAIDCLVVLLQHLDDRSKLVAFLKWIAVEESLTKVLEALLNRSKEINMKQDEIKDLTRLCAEKGKTESLLKLVAWHKNIFHNAYDDGDSLIHLIARKGHIQTAKAILRHMDVQTRDKNEMGQTALHVAIQEGHIITSALILKTDEGLAEIKDNKKMTPLMYACQKGNIYNVKLLLDMQTEDQVKKGFLDCDVNGLNCLDHAIDKGQTEPQVKIGFLDCDVNGLNCLDHAIDNGHEMIAMELLGQNNWRSLMTHVTIDGGTITTPMRKLINSMPGVCKFVLDKCITTQGKNKDIQLGDVEIKVDFELLEDWYSEWMRKAIPVPLGIESKVISDSSLTASGECNDLGAKNGRLNLPQTAWSPKVKDAKQWIQVDLLHPYRIISVATQGRQDESQWVTSYKLEYGMNGKKFHTVQDISKNPVTDMIFTGNVDCSTIVTNTLPVPQVCRYVRLKPVSSVGWISLRMEIYGEAIHVPLGLESKVIPDSSLTASSKCSADLGAASGRLNLAKKAWTPTKRDANKWIQVDLLNPYRIISVATQGRQDKSQWVTSYKLEYSMNGKKFDTVQDISANPVADMIFTGNGDCNTIVINTLPVPQVCRYVRLKPVSSVGRVSLRMEIYGEVILNDPVPLGLESNDIPDSSLTASTKCSDDLGATKGRLNLAKTAWSPKVKDANQWIQVELLKTCRIFSVATQGRQDESQWVTSYKLDCSTDGKTFHTVQDIYANPVADMIFTGNVDCSTIVTNTLPVPQICRYVRLKPVSSVGWISLRMEIYGEGDYRSPGLCDNDKDKETLVSSDYIANWKLKCDAGIHDREHLSRTNNHPVEHMIKNDKSKELLNHPVVRLMFKEKHSQFRLRYWLQLGLQLALLFFLTLHSLVIPPPYYVKQHLSGGNYTWLADGEAKWKEDLNPIALILFGSIGTWLILVLTVIYFCEFLHRKWLYWNTKYNLMHVLLSDARELTLLILIILFVVPGFGDLYFSHGVAFKADWQWNLGAYAVLLAWINVMFFLQTASFFGIYILMFIEVISTMAKFLLVAGIFICTFAVVFCILIVNQTQYHTFGDSLAKSLTMLIGGIDFDTVFHPTDYLHQPSAADDFTSVVFYPHTTHIIFIIFLLTMPIVVMNLLTGLAVYDIERIREKAQIIKLTLEADGIIAMQNYVWKKSVLQPLKTTVLKDVSSFRAIYYELFGYKNTHDYLVAFLEELKTEGHNAYRKTTDMKIDAMMDRINDNKIEAHTLHLESISGNEQIKKQMQVIQDKMCRGKVA